MEFGISLLSPDYHRKPDFTYTDPPEKMFEFKCAECRSNVSFRFTEIIGKEWSWKNSFDDETVNEIKQFFGMNIVGKSPDGGWPAVNIISCSSCATRYILYAGVEEVANSVYVITIQGITELIDY